MQLQYLPKSARLLQTKFQVVMLLLWVFVFLAVLAFVDVYTKVYKLEAHYRFSSETMLNEGNVALTPPDMSRVLRNRGW